jgi:cobalt transporter subunit CbtB
MQETVHTSIAVPGVRIAAKLPVFAVFAFGLVVLYAVGFSESSAAHNATHDTRHANGFPCH